MAPKLGSIVFYHTATDEKGRTCPALVTAVHTKKKAGKRSLNLTIFREFGAPEHRPQVPKKNRRKPGRAYWTRNRGKK